MRKIVWYGGKYLWIARQKLLWSIFGRARERGFNAGFNAAWNLVEKERKNAEREKAAQHYSGEYTIH